MFECKCGSRSVVIVNNEEFCYGCYNKEIISKISVNHDPSG